MNINKSIKLMLTLGTYLYEINHWTCCTPLNVIQINTQIGDCVSQRTYDLKE